MESNLKRIVSEATRLCRERGQQVEANIIAYVASLQAAKGAFVVAGALSLEQELDAASVAAIGQQLLPLLLSPSDAWVGTARMQVMMEVAYRQQREVIEKEQAEQQERSGMLSRAVTGPRAIKGNSADAYEKFYKLIMEYVCVEAGLELALHDETAGAEVRAALESVFPISAVARYMTLSEGEKYTQVEELARITTGICLYNRAVGRGGHALPAAAQQYLPQASRLLGDIGRCASDTAAGLRAVNTQLARLPGPAPPPPAEGDSAEAAAAAAAAADAAAPERARLQAESLHRGQALQLFESLQGDLQEGLDATQQLDSELEHLLVQVQDAVGHSAAVSKDMVYPLFDRLGAIHTALHQELRMLVVRQRLFDELVELQTPPAASTSAGGAAAATSKKGRTVGVATASTSTSTSAAYDAPAAAPEPLSAESMAALDAVENGVGVEGLAYIRATSASQLQAGLALAGFCPVCVSDRAAGPPTLARANPSLGYLAFKEQVYGFGSNAALQAFVADPDGCLTALSAAAAAEPLLVRLLGLPPPSAGQDVHAVLGCVSGPLKVDFGCQTPVHFLERNIDPNYEWNVWALRRRALALANLRGKATHSAQTAASHFKRENETQVWRPKEATVQTRVNKGQTMPKKLQYVQGLRGAPDVKMNVVRLELNLGQPHQH